MNPYVYIAAAVGVVVALGVSYFAGRGDGANAVQVEWDAERLATAAAIQQQVASARAAEHAATESIATLRERTNETLRSINARHRADLDRLRQQARDGGANGGEGAAAVVAACADPSVAAGDERLVVGARDLDLDFPIHFAADAAQVAAALDACREQYELVRVMVNGVAQ